MGEVVGGEGEVMGEVVGGEGEVMGEVVGDEGEVMGKIILVEHKFTANTNAPMQSITANSHKYTCTHKHSSLCRSTNALSTVTPNSDTRLIQWHHALTPRVTAGQHHPPQPQPAQHWTHQGGTGASDEGW